MAQKSEKVCINVDLEMFQVIVTSAKRYNLSQENIWQKLELEWTMSDYLTFVTTTFTIQ